MTFKGANQNVPNRIIAYLRSWTDFDNDDIKYFSGKVIYQKAFIINKVEKRNHVLDLGNVQDLDTVEMNGKNIGVLWTFPFKIDITSAIKPGKNIIKIGLTNL